MPALTIALVVLGSPKRSKIERPQIPGSKSGCGDNVVLPRSRSAGFILIQLRGPPTQDQSGAIGQSFFRKIKRY